MKYVISVKKVLNMCTTVEADSYEEAVDLIECAYNQGFFEDDHCYYPVLETEDHTQWYIDHYGEENFDNLEPEVNDWIGDYYNDAEEDWYDIDNEDDEDE